MIKHIVGWEFAEEAEGADKATNVAAYIRSLDAEAAAIADARKAMERRQSALERHADRLRDYLKSQMERTGLTRMKNPWLTLRIQANPPSVIIEDETMVPERFKQPVTTIKLLKSDSITKGIAVTLNNNKLTLDFHVIVAYGVSILAVSDNLISNVKYKVEEFTGIEIEKINIFVEGVRVID